jgi:NADPH-dependent curcumin reductase CurA
MGGFIVTDHRDRFAEARADMMRWLDEGALHAAEDIVDGLENAPATLRRLFEGKNLGKQLLRVADPE